MRHRQRAEFNHRRADDAPLDGCFLFLLLTGALIRPAVRAADKIRIGFPDLAAPFIPLAIADRSGFFQEQAIQAEFISMNPAVALQTLVGGEIDYYAVLGPGVAAAIRGVPVKLIAAYVPVSPSSKKIKERPDEIKRVIQASIKANRFIRQYHDRTPPVMADWLKIDREMAAATYDSTVTFSEDLSLPEAGFAFSSTKPSVRARSIAKFL